MPYPIARGGKYRPLTSVDDSPHADHNLDAIGQCLLDIAIHLDENPTWVKFTDTQRKQIDRSFEHEYQNVFVFGNDDMVSAVLRYLLDVFRIAMRLTGLVAQYGKGYYRSERRCRYGSQNSPCLFEDAFVVGTTLKKSKDEVHYKFLYNQQKSFVDMPTSFKRSEIIAEGNVRKISVSIINRLLKKAEESELIASPGGGYFKKTTLGKDVKTSEVP